MTSCLSLLPVKVKAPVVNQDDRRGLSLLEFRRVSKEGTLCRCVDLVQGIKQVLRHKVWKGERRKSIRGAQERSEALEKGALEMPWSWKVSTTATMFPTIVSLPVYLLFCLLLAEPKCTSEGKSSLVMKLEGLADLGRTHRKAQSIDWGAWVCVLYGYTRKTPQDRNKARLGSNWRIILTICKKVSPKTKDRLAAEHTLKRCLAVCSCGQISGTDSRCERTLEANGCYGLGQFEGEV